MRYYSHIDLLAMPMPDAPGEDGGAPEASAAILPVGQIDAQGRVRIQVLPEGKFPHPWYGTLDWSPERLQRMVENFRRGVMGYVPMLNFDHSTENWNAAEARAAGWFVDLEYMPGRGLFAVIELTNLGADAITNRHYRYISAETCDTYIDSTGNKFPDVLSGAALTNSPFHDTMASLFGHPVEGVACFSRAAGPGEPTRSFWVAREGGSDRSDASDGSGGGAENAPEGRPEDGQKGKPMSKLFERLRKAFAGLPETATEEDAIAALSGEQGTEAQAEPPAAADAPQAFQAPAGHVVVALAELERLRASERQAEEERQRLAREQVAAAVEEQIQAGRITPAMREDALHFATADLERFKRLYEAAPALVPLNGAGFRRQESSVDGEVVLTDADHRVIERESKLTGKSVEDAQKAFVAARKARAQRESAARA
ncbi:MAG TPA: phage protease [Vicinamibacterales bacterium]|nr:phage protease [Vicinamibacterales bacterium]